LEIARQVRDRIRKELKLAASIGVAANKFVAKVASDLRKPDGLVLVEAGTERKFLSDLEIRRLWGVGPKTELQLKKMGVHKIGELARLPLEQVSGRLGKSGEAFWRLAQGLDDRPVSTEEGFKSIGHETTFEQDTADRKKLHDTLLELSERVAQRLRSHNARAHTITLKLRLADFTTFTRQTSVSEPVNTGGKLFLPALQLMNALLHKGDLVRLIGISGSKLIFGSSAEQLPLFNSANEKERRLASAMDEVIRRYGDESITRAALIKKREKITN
jgi:DNA polymerase-4